ncbi:hypothetical protein AB205_0208110 [Aquarana catesbeiana]|uniref:Uncharacterized protein n=1 Tax=Aquarana catesbeiana TaxID=8400 RepID=A0A2G9RM52_AQUCT|nr:hypothetical protein AB205_0208110 [Aquarana catesbeiana]
MPPSVSFAVIRSCEGICTYRRWWKTIGCGNLPVDTADLFALLRMSVYVSEPGHSMETAFQLLSKQVCLHGNYSITIQYYGPLGHGMVRFASLVAVGVCTRLCLKPCACRMVLHTTVRTRHYCISIRMYTCLYLTLLEGFLCSHILLHPYMVIHILCSFPVMSLAM